MLCAYSGRGRPSWFEHRATVSPPSRGPEPRFREEAPSFATCANRLERRETSITSKKGGFAQDFGFGTAQSLYFVAFKIWLAAVPGVSGFGQSGACFVAEAERGPHQRKTAGLPPPR